MRVLHFTQEAIFLLTDYPFNIFIIAPLALTPLGIHLHFDALGDLSHVKMDF